MLKEFEDTAFNKNSPFQRTINKKKYLELKEMSNKQSANIPISFDDV